jgi:3-oxoacyl-[acyl-carrier protein] reductase
MDLGIKNKNVLITGASQGIGKATALAFAKEKCNVSIIARRKDKLEEVLKEMGGKEKKHLLYATDLMESKAPTKAVYELTKDRSYDIVVHNVGGTLDIRDVLSPVADWNKVLKFNAGIAIEMNRYLIPPMQEQKWGRVIHISSLSAENMHGCGPYCAAKYYLNAYTKALGKGVAKDGIVVSAIMPGTIYEEGGKWDEKNPKNAENLEEFKRKKADFLRHYQHIGRFGTPEEITSFVLFMASQHVTFATTSIIPVGGTELFGL